MAAAAVALPIATKAAEGVQESPFRFIFYIPFAILSPWFWLLGLVLWPLLAYLLPRSTDEDGKEHWRWKAGFWVAFFISFAISYVMVMAGFALLPSVLKIATATSNPVAAAAT